LEIECLPERLGPLTFAVGSYEQWILLATDFTLPKTPLRVIYPRVVSIALRTKTTRQLILGFWR